jgi:ElaB/YqjD/DUF883 family membrane-anchored ribosome-binding protein
MTNRNGMGNTRSLDSLKDSVRGLVDQGQEKVHQMKDRVVDAKDQAVSRGNEVLDKVSAYIKANPIKSIGIAFGAGYIGMRLFRR